MATISRFLTPREISSRLGANVHLVRGILETLEDVTPRGFADSVPVYDQATMQRLKYELNLLEAKEGESNGK